MCAFIVLIATVWHIKTVKATAAAKQAQEDFDTTAKQRLPAAAERNKQTDAVAKPKVGDGSHIWGINSANNIYYRNGKGGNWVRIDNTLKQVSVSGDGSHVWGVNENNDIWYRNGKNGKWVKIDNIDNSKEKITYISVS